MTLPIYRVVTTDRDGNHPTEILVTPFRHEPCVNTIAVQLEEMWSELEQARQRRADFETCSMCGLLVETDERGDVLDSSGRCDSCRP